MLWRLLQRLADLYGAGAILIILFFLGMSYLTSHRITPLDFLFPYGVLAGLLISRIHMSTGGFIALFSVAGYYIAELAMTGGKSTYLDNFWPIILAGPGFLYVMAGTLKSINILYKKRR